MAVRRSSSSLITIHPLPGPVRVSPITGEDRAGPFLFLHPIPVSIPTHLLPVSSTMDFSKLITAIAHTLIVILEQFAAARRRK